MGDQALLQEDDTSQASKNGKVLAVFCCYARASVRKCITEHASSKPSGLQVVDFVDHAALDNRAILSNFDEAFHWLGTVLYACLNGPSWVVPTAQTAAKIRSGRLQLFS